MGNGVRPFGAGHLHLAPGDQRPRERGSQEVAGLVHGVRTQDREDEVPDELLAQVHHVHAGRSGPHRLVADRNQLLPLPQVGGERDHLRAVRLDQPAEDHGGVEAAGVGQHDLLRLHRSGPGRAEQGQKHRLLDV
jgi:hypothetical protein